MPRNAQRHSFFNPRRNVYRKCLFALHFAAAITLRTGLLDQLSPSAACWTGGDLLKGHPGFFAASHALAGAATDVTSLGLSAGLCTRAMAGWTTLTFRKANAFLAPSGNAFERNLDYDFNIFPTPRARVSSTKKAVEESLTTRAEIKSQTTEDFIEVDSAK